jgi:M-phase inducer tyrosine phosphatase
VLSGAAVHPHDARFDQFPTLTPAGLRELIANPASRGYDLVVIVDARFADEWEGGHIKDSRNVRKMSELEALFKEYCRCKACVVFHCEYSQYRGPEMMQAFRDLDRKTNSKRYPELSFPSIFLLKGGYREFFKECPDLCDGGYRPMRGSSFVTALKDGPNADNDDQTRRNWPEVGPLPSFALGDVGLISA